MLLNSRIIVGICGGIASYKAVELVSQLQQAGALVDVIMTEHAGDFVSPLTFATMSHRRVYSDLWEPSGEAAELHIALAREADLLAVVPATANTIAKLAGGAADNMLTAVALATRAPLLLAPAMYKDMYTHPATQANLNLLRERGAYIVEPEVGRLASGDVGPGRLPDTASLLGAIRLVLGRSGDLAGRRVIITAGGTHEPIDPVRYIGNRSSGKMGYSLAIEARDRGAHVLLISGPVALPAPYGIEVQRVETAVQMRDAVYSSITDADVLIMSAAVADFRPAEPAAQKIKKVSGQARGQSETDAFSLHLVQNPDILKDLAEPLQESHNRNEQPRRRLIRVGFAAETEDIIANARHKLAAKQLDLLVANDVTRSDSGFATDTNKVLIFHADGAVEDLPVMAKSDVAAAIWDRVVPFLGTM
ncbi:bifunctional phosphopantothenoylcysteine decarboxylase/phosphopantothenate--cysteine ligase CoaBC [Ktedonosporobacter rubrisoli]|uniref:Coenzyme A biosynthesis bifunctional protein CoaBC n=1 Tax=Ktedonosporobacter rubrisoli TaxID=2509675 RepID=A0A4P6JYD8_KTERU|nr:bifunctional phosphopantothenoylcysteine decarboxylase/phosphopantothenate--cysteine ligase CoaBC [Ktedonosporobacter rubrisoli]QBD80056.1 bifunctional phosphopantothenoylcysteine decarboxylase/phosphopantothenate--cysteine ligase CoaBC [Ktedonosporobacter rubrisoli]